MAQGGVDSSWSTALPGASFNVCFDLRMGEDKTSDVAHALEVSTSSPCHNDNIPKPPPLPVAACSKPKVKLLSFSYVPKETMETWDKLFMEGYGADVHILTEDNTIIPAHSSVLGVASTVMRNYVTQAKVKDGIRYIKILGVPSSATGIFIRFIYSSCYDQDEMKNYGLHLLVLSHSFSILSLKRICINVIEQSCLTTENAIDVLLLARQCDAPRLSLICLHMIVKDFKKISSTEGWKVMRKSNPALEQELLEWVVERDSKKQELIKKMEEKKIYLQLHEAMEALLHICKDGCRTIGPRDKLLKGSQIACGFPACKGLETLVRHFSVCKIRVPGGCTHCKRMWQLLELHSCICNEPDYCKVPLCR
ncbi:hypothetical protein GIB67_032858 [Kingdonia uniflora]|uniref:BTB/POZ and TAZ domain-containing protein 3 n=1 Tax=Kingdonia uniflora TaxID=39325 RepID=A0A7J7NC92_9MAGN|nr:hypothetical protein GIB67_032858 [Kingdonia uniflora]